MQKCFLSSMVVSLLLLQSVLTDKDATKESKSVVLSDEEEETSLAAVATAAATERKAVVVQPKTVGLGIVDLMAAATGYGGYGHNDHYGANGHSNYGGNHGDHDKYSDHYGGHGNRYGNHGHSKYGNHGNLGNYYGEHGCLSNPATDPVVVAATEAAVTVIRATAAIRTTPAIRRRRITDPDITVPRRPSDFRHTAAPVTATRVVTDIDACPRPKTHFSNGKFYPVKLLRP